MPLGTDDIRWLIHIPKEDLALLLLWAASHVMDDRGSFEKDDAQNWLMQQEREAVETKLTEMRENRAAASNRAD